MLIDISTSSPPYKVTQKKVTEELKRRMPGRPAASRLIEAASRHSGIENRYFIVPDGESNSEKNFFSENGNYRKPDTQTRMIEYEKWSAKLAKEAVRKILDENNFDPKNIERLITISCTGFFAPGLDYEIINEFKIPLSVKRTNIGFMGCAASIIGFNSVLEAMSLDNENAKNTLMISVELCSIHLQTEATRDNILANMIFADGCAAALFSNSKNYKNKIRLKIVSTDSVLFEKSSEFMGWKIGNFGFEMMLSSDLPRIILEKAVPKLKEILSKYNLTPDKINHWALHPGGRSILDSLQNGLTLSDEKMIPSRNVLKNFGNMSSASILFVLKEILLLNNIKKDDYCCAVAFGPGLTMEVAIMKGV